MSTAIEAKSALRKKRGEKNDEKKEMEKKKKKKKHNDLAFVYQACSDWLQYILLSSTWSLTCRFVSHNERETSMIQNSHQSLNSENMRLMSEQLKMSKGH